MLGWLKEDNLFRSWKGTAGWRQAYSSLNVQCQESFFFSNGLTTADLNTDGKLPVERESLITEVKDGRRSSMSSASNDDGRGSSSHVLMAVLFNTSRTIDSDTGWKAVSGDSSKTV